MNLDEMLAVQTFESELRTLDAQRQQLEQQREALMRKAQPKVAALLMAQARLRGPDVEPNDYSYEHLIHLVRNSTHWVATFGYWHCNEWNTHDIEFEMNELRICQA